jgi:Spy/CpxP family protein refolding chaperone
MKRALIGIAGGLLLAGSVLAQPYGMGPGMMGGYGSGGYGMGPGMMGGPGGYGMGPGMMGGYANEAYAGLDLSPEQRKKVADIQRETAKAQWQLMGTMHQQGYHMYGMFGPGIDEADARKSFQTMAETQKAMFEMQLEARKKIDAVLTKEQREQLRRYWSSRQ